ncbi:uncharacterized protein [Desmodus rotundus]|uniref:uncharacterized protein n=1 Tax=Desmodus rotundus TaxID=9430 RepID=UPI0039E40692
MATKSRTPKPTQAEGIRNLSLVPGRKGGGGYLGKVEKQQGEESTATKPSATGERTGLKTQQWRGAALYRLELEPGAGRGRVGGSEPGAGGTGGGACRARGDINKPTNALRRSGQPSPPSPPAALAPQAPDAELQGSGSLPRAGRCPPPCPPPGPTSSSPTSGPAAQAARSGAHYRLAGGVGPARLRALVPRRRVPDGPLVSTPPPPARPLSFPARLPSSLLPHLLSRSLSPPPLLGPPPPLPTPSLRLPSSFPPFSCPRAQAFACSSSAAAALAAALALRSRPEAARTGGPQSWRERPGRAAGPSAHCPTSSLCGPAGDPRTLREEGWTPQPPILRWAWQHPASAALLATLPGALLQPVPHGALCYLLALPPRWVPASSTGRRDSGPSSSLAGVKCLLQTSETLAAFALQFSRPPPEPTVLCLPQHWG